MCFFLAEKKEKVKKWFVLKCWLLSFEGCRLLLYLWPSSRRPMDKDIGAILPKKKKLKNISFFTVIFTIFGHQIPGSGWNRIRIRIYLKPGSRVCSLKAQCWSTALIFGMNIGVDTPNYCTRRWWAESTFSAALKVVSIRSSVYYLA